MFAVYPAVGSMIICGKAAYFLEFPLLVWPWFEAEELAGLAVG
jgi:hypothetical protein